MLKCLNLCSLSVLHYSSNMIFISMKRKISRILKEIHTLNYNIMQMIFSCGIFFLVRVVMNNKTSICKMKMFDLIFGPLSPTSVALWAYMFVWVEHWNVFAVTSMRSLLPNRMEFCVITVIVNLWVGKHRKFTSIKIYHMKVKY